MGTIVAIQAELVEEFDMFEDWMEKYEYIIDLGKSLPMIDDKHKIEDNLIKGCQSRVWLHADNDNGIITYTADSDAIITKGIVAILIRVLSKQKAAEIAKADLVFIDKIGLKEQLSQTRANGLLSMVKEMKLYALALKDR
ncbi:MAG TPA: SufE family protein [Flavobacteriales bacterium]|jgi:cysteine desulfuration protein SufE|nr:SufE family protein [Flavobacteriales bacterium]HIL66907.1 SufE family protein [Flavobacteriales bacterium]|tara:strand:- start:1347 stop:1766 length:420 start_codon:yes stop_codon:yes gene_type:complete